MRFFDLIGALFTAAWFILVGAFIVFALGEEQRGLLLADGVVDLREGTLWMSIHKEGEDIGVLREVRTRLIDGWLIELQGVMEIPMLDDAYGLRFYTKTVLTEDLMLKNALGDLEALGMRLSLDARVQDADQGYRLQVRVTLDQATESFTIALNERPMLATHALPKMLASDDLSPGKHFAQQFFDPMTLSPTQIRLTYDGQETLEHYGEIYEAHRFRQKISGMDALIYVDDHGEVIRQALPFHFSMGRIPDFLGNQLFRETTQRLDDIDKPPPAFAHLIDAQTLLTMVSHLGGGQLTRNDRDTLDTGDDPPLLSRLYVFDDLFDTSELHLESPRQRIRTQVQGRVEIEAGTLNSLWHIDLGPEPSQYQGQLHLDTTPEMDRQDEVISRQFSQESPSAKLILAAFATQCDVDTGEEIQWEIPSIKDLSEGPLFCLHYVADALHSAGYPPHFIYGLYDDGSDEAHFRVWLATYGSSLYDDDSAPIYFEIDPLSPGGQVGPDHLQLLLSDRYEPQRVRALFEELQLLDGPDTPLSEAP